MKIDKYFHMYGTKNDIRFEEVTADVREVVRGEWLPKEKSIGGVCSRCGTACLTVEFGENGICSMWNYCPNCGAKMEGET